MRSIRASLIAATVGLAISAWSCNSPADSAHDKNRKDRISVLIVDGMNNHDWQRTTDSLLAILNSCGLFEVDVSTSPPGNAPEEQWQQWNPAFDKYDVVISNFNGGHTPRSKHWPRKLEESLEDYVADGGGLVIFHAANNSFINWPAYNEMIGLGWRKKDFGVSIRIADDGAVIRVPAGQGDNPGHGPDHDYQMTVLNRTHPITRGVPIKWMHPLEQLSHGQHGPAKNITILSYAWSKDSRKNEPMEWVVKYGQGRVYTTVLGHLWKNQTDLNLRCVGFQTMLIRGVEWAATGKVSFPVPPDFPTATEISTNDLLDNHSHILLQESSN